MGRVGKIIVGIFLGLLLTVIVAAGFFWFRGGEIARNILETTITKALGEPTQVEVVKLNPFGGKITIPQITVSNPSGLSTPYFMQINGLDVSIKPLSLLQPTLQIDNFIIDTWNINAEQTLSKGNITELVAYIQKNQKPQSSNNQPAKAKKIASSQVTIGSVNTKLRFAFFNQSIDREFKFDNIALTNLTSDNAGAVFLEQYVVRLVAQTLKSVLSASKGQLEQNLPQLPDLPFLKNDPLKSLQDLIDRLSLPQT